MKFSEIKKHIMTGISFLIPMVVMAGIMGAIQKAYSWSGVALSDPTISGLAFSGYSITKISDFMAVLGKLNGEGFNWAYAFLAAGIGFSIADRPAIVPAFAIGYYAGGPTKTGFIAGLNASINYSSYRYSCCRICILRYPDEATFNNHAGIPGLDSVSCIWFIIHRWCCYWCMYGLRYGWSYQQDCIYGCKRIIC